MIIAYLLLNYFFSKNCENRLLNKVCMIGCMTCPWAPTAGERRLNPVSGMTA